MIIPMPSLTSMNGSDERWSKFDKSLFAGGMSDCVVSRVATIAFGTAAV